MSLLTQEVDTQSPRFTGTQVNYYFVCQRKLWLFSHGIEMEHESDLVLQGRLVGQTSYGRKKHEIAIDNRIVLDFLEVDWDAKGRLIIHEVKKSRAMEEAHRWQVLYYLYYLKRKGVEALAVLDYLLLRRKERLELDAAAEERLREVLAAIANVVASPRPPAPERRKACLRCAYYEFCWA